MVNQICNVFVCLSFFIPLKNFSLIWIVSITGEGLLGTHIVLSHTTGQHSYPLNSEGSLACYTYMGHRLYGHLRGPVTLTLID